MARKKKAPEEVEAQLLPENEQTPEATTPADPVEDTENGITETKDESAASSAPEETLSGTEYANDPDNTPDLYLIIPYLKSEAAGEELQLAMRSWAENFPAITKIIVIGDKENYFNPETVVHIPHTPVLIKENCNCEVPKTYRNPQVDVANKLLTVLASGLITSDFILSNDDIFLPGPIQLEDISILKAFGTVESGGGLPAGIFYQNALRTMKLLKKNNLPLTRYGTHTPVVLNPEKLAEVIAKYRADQQGVLLTTLYFNDLYPNARPVQVNGGKFDPILASVYKPNPDRAVLKKALLQRKFINCNSEGWKALGPEIKSRFPDPCRFEK